MPRDETNEQIVILFYEHIVTGDLQKAKTHGIQAAVQLIKEFITQLTTEEAYHATARNKVNYMTCEYKVLQECRKNLPANEEKTHDKKWMPHEHQKNARTYT